MQRLLYEMKIFTLAAEVVRKVTAKGDHQLMESNDVVPVARELLTWVYFGIVIFGALYEKISTSLLPFYLSVHELIERMIWSHSCESRDLQQISPRIPLSIAL